MGGLLGVAVPWLLRLRNTNERGVTVVFALSVLLLTTAAYGLKISPLLAALTFITARHEAWPLSMRLGGLGAFAILAVLVMLPRVKGGLIGVLWRMRARD